MCFIFFCLACFISVLIFVNDFGRFIFAVLLEFFCVFFFYFCHLCGWGWGVWCFRLFVGFQIIGDLCFASA